jgi:hypothetical protein
MPGSPSKVPTYWMVALVGYIGFASMFAPEMFIRHYDSLTDALGLERANISAYALRYFAGLSLSWLGIGLRALSASDEIRLWLRTYD